MKRIPQFGDAYVDMAMQDLHRILTEARLRSLSIAEVGADELAECLSIVASQPRAIRRQCFRWLQKVHPNVRFEVGGGNA
jgi:hypothetical protein